MILKRDVLLSQKCFFFGVWQLKHKSVLLPAGRCSPSHRRVIRLQGDAQRSSQGTAHLSVSLVLSIYLSVSLVLSIYMSVSLELSIYLSVSLDLSIYLSVSLELSIYLSVSLDLSIYLSVSLELSISSMTKQASLV